MGHASLALPGARQPAVGRTRLPRAREQHRRSDSCTMRAKTIVVPEVQGGLGRAAAIQPIAPPEVRWVSGMSTPLASAGLSPRLYDRVTPNGNVDRWRPAPVAGRNPRVALRDPRGARQRWHGDRLP